MVVTVVGAKVVKGVVAFYRVVVVVFYCGG